MKASRKSPFHGKRLSFAACLAMLALLCMGVANAATYYVSNSGNDGNSGTSTSAPWQTAAKVNTFAFQPGDTVLFQSGGKWYESLNPQGSSGVAGSPISFGTYGTGSKPLFSGGQTLANAGFTFVSGTVWQYNIATQINAVYVNKVALIPANPNANQQVAAIPNSFYWSNGVLQINVATNPNTDGNLYEGAVRQDIIANGNPASFTFTNHLVFSNLAEEESGQVNEGYGVRIQNGTDITLNNIESYRCGKHNFGAINSTQVTFNGCLAEYPMPGEQAYGGYTAYVSYGDNSTGLAGQTSVYNNCVGDHMEDTTPGQAYQDTNYEFFTSHGSNLGSVLLNNCRALSSSAGGAGAHWSINNVESGATIQIHGGFIQNNQLVMSGGSLLVDGLTIQGPGPNSTNDATATIDMECSNSTVQNVLMENINVGYWLYQAAIQDNGTSNTIRFNTLVNDPNSADASIVNRDNSESLYGNIFVNPGNPVQGNAPATNLYNLAYTSTAGAGFVNPSANNYALTSTAPARDYVPLSLAYPATDNAGTPRPDGSANDAGAFTYGSGGPPPAPVISSPATASGTVGSPFTYQITASNSPTGYGESGTLPAGLTFNAATGVISGTPTAAGSQSVTISATNGGGTGSASLAITISSPTPPVITSPATASGTVGSAFSYQITASNGPTSYGASGLPAGLSVNTSTGLISGTPTAAGTSSVTVSAKNAGGTGTKTVSVTITTAPPTAYNVYALWTPGTTITNGGADSYGNGYNASLVGTTVSYVGNTTTFGPANAADAWSNVTVALPAGTYTKLNMIGSAVGGTVTGQVFVVNYTDGTTQTFTQNLSDWGSTQGYAGETVVNSQSTRLASNGSVASIPTFLYGYTFNLNGKSVKSITLPNTRQVIAFGFTTGTGTTPSKPVISSATSASGTVGKAFTYQITASNSPTSYGASGLPAGLSVNTSTGVISGTPTGPGVSSVTLSATNAGGTGTATLTLTVSSPPTPYNVYALWTPGSTITNGGADSYGNGYNANLVGTSVTYAGSTYTLGPTNAADAWSNVTVALPPGTYTKLNMVGSAVGGTVTGQVFTVNYTDGTTQTFTQNLSDWGSTQGYAGETVVNSQTTRLATNGSSASIPTFIYGYTFTLNGKSVKSITLPPTRQVIAFGFTGH